MNYSDIITEYRQFLTFLVTKYTEESLPPQATVDQLARRLQNAANTQQAFYAEAQIKAFELVDQADETVDFESIKKTLSVLTKEYDALRIC